MREAACQTVIQEQDTTFVPVNIPVSNNSLSTATAAYIQAGNSSISITNEASAEFIGNLLKACSHTR